MSSASTALRRRTCLRYTLGALLLRAAVDRLELLERDARADSNAGERRLRQLARHLALVVEALLQSLQKRAATGERDAAVHDVPGQLGRRLVERLLDRGDDVADRLLERLADLLRGQFDRFRQAGDEVAAADLGAG